jgi:transcriptional regulator with XRE-family HTH domain
MPQDRSLSASDHQSDEDEEARFLAEIIATLVRKRLDKGVSLKELGGWIGYDPGFLSRAERNLTRPGVIPLIRWAHALGTDFVDIAVRVRDEQRRLTL